MKTSDVLLAVAALIAVVSLICIGFYPSVQHFMASNKLWNGISSLSSEFDATNIDSLQELPELPQEKTLIAIPYLQYEEEELSKMRDFVTGGGGLLLMDDYGYGNSVLEYLGLNARFSGAALLDPIFCYKNQRLPKVMNFSPRLEESGLQVVVLNHATTLTDVSESRVIAWSSSSSFLDLDEDESWSSAEPRGPFPVAAEFKLGVGTVALVSDPSIMINSMMGKDDNYSFIEYLISPGLEPRQILVDRSHLPKDPRDESRIGLMNLRRTLAMPYPLLGLTAGVLIVISRYTLKKGEKIG